MRVRVGRVWRLAGLLALHLAMAGASAQTPDSSPASSPPSLPSPARTNPGAVLRPADRAVPGRTARAIPTPISRNRPVTLVSPITAEWTAYQSRLAGLQSAVTPSPDDQESTGSPPQVPWWTLQVDQVPTIDGNGQATRPVPKDIPSAVKTPERQPSRTAEAAGQTPADLASEPSQSIGLGTGPRSERSNLPGIIIASIITVLALALKGMSLRRRRVRIKRDYREEPVLDQLPVADASRFRTDAALGPRRSAALRRIRTTAANPPSDHLDARGSMAPRADTDLHVSSVNHPTETA
jgi:hypothetical protein